MKRLSVCFTILFATLNIACAYSPNTPLTEESTMPELSEIYLTANGVTWTVTLEQNKSAAALVELLQKGDIKIHAKEYGGFEKVGSLGTSLPRNDTQITGQPGDLILYQGNQITLYYDTNSWSFTKLGHINGATKQSLLAVLGSGDVDLLLSVRK